MVLWQRLFRLSAKLTASNYVREQALLRQFAPYLPAAAVVADVGAGSCKLTELLSRQTDLQVMPFDVVDHNMTKLPLALFDGKQLPLKDKEVGISLLVFVLHHAEQPIELFNELKRVSAKRLIVIEDTPVGLLERFAWRKWDYWLNHGFGRHFVDDQVAAVVQLLPAC
jgi:ubiquinone/menaquinone biosynthesis C-methylase UbiE